MKVLLTSREEDSKEVRTEAAGGRREDEDMQEEDTNVADENGELLN